MFQAPRGTSDHLPEEQKYWRFIESKAVEVAARFGFGRIDTPAFEDSNLFIRSVGEGTDIVEKEMYTFDDRGGDSITLRPEGTAPVCRAYLEHGMHNLPQPVRLYYFCPVFRYERPQAGRFRQHHQFGVEVLGDGDPSVDAEVIEVAWDLMTSLGLTDINLLINSVGDPQCRPAYVEKLREYYSGHKEKLCTDCKERLDRNPLRLLDCKVERDHVLGNDAPKSADNLCGDCSEHWNKLLKYLDAMRLPYQIDHRMVRGLDYYTRTVFEVQPVDGGGQSTICGGGRYDGLITALGGRDTPGIGFATGLERLTLNLKRSEVSVPEEPKPRYLVANVGDDARIAALELSVRLRRAGVGVILGSGTRGLRGQMRQANALEIPFALILGDDEIEKGEVMVRDMESSAQESRPVAEFIEEVTKSHGRGA
ncbi:MAG: histidine--tRNA ligase [Chloroflexi bacterium]|nr:histidine--tRNA ligase [Dehalococcoidia bacterium]RUA21464.1 MAG: histidine--tRNA ligase [Chloroflexota bacterium]RUA28895.1 MAG: histidine--tRNA ligase [Chloroflexota bacterium]